MNNVELELRDVVLKLTVNNDPVSHKATVDKYFTRDASFQHPLATVPKGPNSREQLKNVYAVYKYATRDIDIDIQRITVDANATRAVVELEESLSARHVPLLRVKRLKIITILDFVRDKKDNKFYITNQYDAFPIDAASQVLPLGFFYGWWMYAAGFTGNIVGGLLQKTGLW